MAAYRYSPLPDASCYIRVLEIAPSPCLDEPVACSLVVQKLEDGQPYSALSYSWGMNESGDASLDRNITIDDATKPVTRNLLEGIRRIRDCSKPIRLWADAVSINQGDELEKNEQVRMMAMIYERASSTIVWLGEGRTAQEDLAMASVRSCLSYDGDSHTKAQHSWTSSDDRQRLSICELHNPAFTKTFSPELVLAVRGVVANADRFLRRSFFGRSWIVQELQRSKEGTVCFYWGAHYCTEASLARFLDSLIDRLNWQMQAAAGIDVQETDHLFQLQWRVRDIVRRDILRAYAVYMPPLVNDLVNRTDLTVVVHRCRYLACSDPRDKLYSLISLDPAFGIKADYTLSMVELYTFFASLLVEKRFFNCLFPSLRFNRPKALATGLPSWVPDLRDDNFSCDMEVLSDGQHDPEFHCNIDSSGILCYNPFLIGTVTSIVPESDIVCNLGDQTFRFTVDRQMSREDPHGRILPGDFCCTPMSPGRSSAMLHLLRRVGCDPSRYKLIRTLYYSAKPSEEWKLPQRDHWDRIDLQIV